MIRSFGMLCLLYASVSVSVGLVVFLSAFGVSLVVGPPVVGVGLVVPVSCETAFRFPFEAEVALRGRVLRRVRGCFSCRWGRSLFARS